MSQILTSCMENINENNIKIMAESKLTTLATTVTAPRSATASPPPNCAICLGTCTNKCFSDSCLHEFCFKCLLEWSKIKAECPLCKQAFKSIIHNIKSQDEYDEHIVETTTVEELDRSLIFLPTATNTAAPHQYHFRTTFTVDTHGEQLNSIQQMLLSHPLLTTIGTFSPDRYHHRRRRGDTTTAFRRSIYHQNLWVYAPPDITGRYRDVSPTHYRRDPAARARLVPWLNRELNALLYENAQLVMRLGDIIMDHLLRHHICSSFFRALLYEYLGNRTDHFIHEFYNFMRSPFDMIGYDRHVIYTERPTSSSPAPYIDVSDYDSDVIFVTPTNEPESNTRRVEPQVIDLVDTDSDELIIVSEELPNNSQRNSNSNISTVSNSNNNNNSSNINNIEEGPSRTPVLPLKLRLKNKHKSKEKFNSHKKRWRIALDDSSTTSSTSSDSDSDYEECKSRGKSYKSKKRQVSSRKSEKRKHVTENTSDSEDNISLSKLPKKRKKSKHSSKHKSSSTNNSKSSKKHHKKRSNDGSTSRSLVRNIMKRTSRSRSTSSERLYSPNRKQSKQNSIPSSTITIQSLEEQSNNSPQILEETSKNLDDKKNETAGPSCSVKYNLSSSSGNSSKVDNLEDRGSCSDDSSYDIKPPLVKSEIKDVSQMNEPSTSTLKEKTNSLWFSRPSNFDSDSSSSS